MNNRLYDRMGFPPEFPASSRPPRRPAPTEDVAERAARKKTWHVAWGLLYDQLKEVEGDEYPARDRERFRLLYVSESEGDAGYVQAKMAGYETRVTRRDLPAGERPPSRATVLELRVETLERRIAGLELLFKRVVLPRLA